MEYEYEGKKITFDKELSVLDKAVIKFVKILDKLGIKYVIISGYVAILFGRSRATEDIDFFIEPLNMHKFVEFCSRIEKEYWILNSSDINELFFMLSDNLSIRAAEKGNVMPNYEIKFALRQHEVESMQQKIEVIVNGNTLFTSCMEGQIAYKFKLGSEKDIEDALHLYEIFGKNLDKNRLLSEAKNLKIYEEMVKNGMEF